MFETKCGRCRSENVRLQSQEGKLENWKCLDCRWEFSHTQDFRHGANALGSVDVPGQLMPSGLKRIGEKKSEAHDPIDWR